MGICRLSPASVMLPLVLLVAGCGQEGRSIDTARDRTSGRAPDPAAATSSKSASSPVVEELTCYTNQRSVGFYDYFTDASSGSDARTPEQAAQSWAAPDEDVVTEKTASGAVVWVLRTDGTAHTRLDLQSFRDGTWAVEQSEACSGPDHGLHRRDQPR